MAGFITISSSSDSSVSETSLEISSSSSSSSEEFLEVVAFFPAGLFLGGDFGAFFFVAPLLKKGKKKY